MCGKNIKDMFIDRFFIISVMESLRVVNAVYTMQSSSAFDVAWLHYCLMETKYYPARPHMLKWKLPMNWKTVQIFPKGTVQIIGKVNMEEAWKMRTAIIEELRQVLDEDILTLSDLKVSTMTMTLRLPFKTKLHELESNIHIDYEPELFPAA